MKKINLEKISKKQLEKERNPNYKYFDIDNKQTAVQWLVEQLKNEEGIDFIPSRIVERAKQIENEQLNIARLDGINLANKGYQK